jgi:hypothetical protein
MRRSTERPLLALLLAALAGSASAAGARLARAPYADAALAAVILDPAVAEISGMAGSRRRDDVVWVHNDSDNGGLLYALGTDGRVRATFMVRGERNIDWEDMTAFERDGRPLLVVADTGDNGGLRDTLTLIVLEEPELPSKPGPTVVLDPLWTVTFRWPDGPRDCEAIAVDARRFEALLLSKKRVPAQLFRVPLARPAEDEVRVARQIADIPHLPQPDAALLARDPKFGRYAGQVTGMDLDPAGTRLVVLTYRDAFLFERAPRERWQRAVGRPPKRFALPPIPQAESIAFDRHGRSIYVSSERLPAPLLRLDPR